MPNPQALPEKIAHYKILRLIASGGMGTVYLAEDTRLGRKAAIKVLDAESAEQSDRIGRFILEAKAASGLNHPNILVIYDIGEHEGLHYIATEYIKGTTLSKKIRNGDLDTSEIIDIALQAASALKAAHNAGIIHRDIKPDNIMIRDDGVLKILDFGLVKLIQDQELVGDETLQNMTKPGFIVGTISYMSPEQARGKIADGRTDIWSLGIVLYEMLVGKPPFEGETPSDSFANILKKEPEALDASISNELRQIVGRAICKDVDQRYQTAAELYNDLKEVQHGLEFTPTSSSIPPVSSAASLSSNTTASELPRPTRAFPPAFSRNQKLIVFGGILALLIAGFAYFGLDRNSAKIRSIAVLPFENESGNADLNYLSDGLSENLIDKLSELRDLKVIARSSSFKYKGNNVDLRQAAEQLGVQGIITGRISRQGDKLLIRAELIEPKENEQIWGESYSGEMADSLSVHLTIAQRIANVLGLASAGAFTDHGSKRPINPEAEDIVLKGKYLDTQFSVSNSKKATEMFEKAVQIDPNYAEAWALLSRSYLRSIGGSHADPKVFLPKAEAAARKALELDEELAAAQLTLATCLLDQFQFAAAEKEIRKALALNPNLSDAHSAYSGVLGFLNRHDESINAARKAYELNPLSLETKTLIGYRYFWAGRYEEAVTELKRVVDVDPQFGFAHTVLGYTYTAMGKPNEAISEFETGIKFRGASSSDQIYLGAAYAHAGQIDKATNILKQLETTSEYVSPCELALLYTALGMKDKAFASLNKAFEARDLQLRFLKADPGYVPLRNDPRFNDLVLRVGLP